MLSSGLVGVSSQACSPLHGFIDPGCQPIKAHYPFWSPPSPHITRPLPAHTNVLQSSQMLLGSRGGFQKVNSQRMTDISEDTAARTPAGRGAGGSGHVAVTVRGHRTPSRFSIIKQIITANSDLCPCTDEAFRCSRSAHYPRLTVMVCSIY